MTDLFDGALTLHGLVGGRGARLDDRPFKLTVDTDEPASPEIGDVWLNTALTVNQVVLSYDKPSGGQNGDAEIRISKPGFEIYGELATILDINNATKIQYAKNWSIAVNYSDESWNGKFPIALIKDLITVFAKFGIARVRSAGEWVYVPGSIWDGTQWQIFSSFDWDVYAGAYDGRLVKIDSDGNIVDIIASSVSTIYPFYKVTVNPDKYILGSTQTGDMAFLFGPDSNQVTINSATTVYDSVIGTGENFYIANGAGVHKYNFSGAHIWGYSGSSILHAVAVDDEGFLYGARSSYLAKISPDRELIWRLDSSWIYTSNVYISVSPNGQHVIVGSNDARMGIVDRQDGSLLTTFRTGSTNYNVTDITIDSDGMIYNGTTDSRIFKSDANGNLIWEVDMGVSGWPYEGHRGIKLTVDPDYNLYVIYEVLGHILKFNSDGELLWIIDTDEQLRDIDVLPGSVGAFPERW